jgi:hypothetical protein
MKISWDGWRKPTPHEAKDAANAIAIGAGVIAGFDVICTNYYWIAAIWAHVAGIAKMVQIFISGDNDHAS